MGKLFNDGIHFSENLITQFDKPAFVLGDFQKEFVSSEDEKTQHFR